MAYILFTFQFFLLSVQLHLTLSLSLSLSLFLSLSLSLSLSLLPSLSLLICIKVDSVLREKLMSKQNCHELFWCYAIFRYKCLPIWSVILLR